jgi:hypothetical protein
VENITTLGKSVGPPWGKDQLRIPLNRSNRMLILFIDKEPWMQKLLFVVALALGGLVTYVDSRPTWDDTGITAAALLVLAGVLGFVGPARPWLWALALGVWIPLLEVVRTQNYAAMLALVVAFAGAYAGAGIRALLFAVPQR